MEARVLLVRAVLIIMALIPIVYLSGMWTWFGPKAPEFADCVKITDKAVKEACMMNVALYSKVSNICGSQLSEPNRDTCYLQFSKKWNMTSTCGKILDNDTMQVCKAVVGVDFRQCSYIPDENKLYACVAAVENVTNTKAVPHVREVRIACESGGLVNMTVFNDGSAPVLAGNLGVTLNGAVLEDNNDTTTDLLFGQYRLTKHLLRDGGQAVLIAPCLSPEESVPKVCNISIGSPGFHDTVRCIKP